MNPIKPKGKLVGFDQIKEGKTLLRLKDGNYLQVILNVHKVLKTERRSPDGNPLYIVATGITMGVWTPDEIAQMDE